MNTHFSTTIQNDGSEEGSRIILEVGSTTVPLSLTDAGRLLDAISNMIGMPGEDTGFDTEDGASITVAREESGRMHLHVDHHQAMGVSAARRGHAILAEATRKLAESLRADSPESAARRLAERTAAAIMPVVNIPSPKDLLAAQASKLTG